MHGFKRAIMTCYEFMIVCYVTSAVGEASLNNLRTNLLNF
jgi:hypothetical protein